MKKESKKQIFLLAIFKSKICKIVFILGLFLGYFLIPKAVFKEYFLLAVLQIFLFALILTCMARITKEKVITLKHTGASFFSIISSVIGFSALHVCNSVCSAGIGVGIFSIFPLILHRYSVFIVLISLVIQIFALYYMGCFKKCLC